MHKLIFCQMVVVMALVFNGGYSEEEMELWQAQCYDENSLLQQTIAENFLSLLKNRISSPESNALILDIGCGNGRITHSLLNSFGDIQIVGLDASPDMINFATEHFADARVRFAVDRAEELKTIQSNYVDGIISFSCLHWVFDQQSAFQRMYDVLKPGGWAGLMFAAETGFDDPLDHAFAQAMQEESWRDYFKEPVVEAGWYNGQPVIIKKQMEEIGFQVVLMDVQNFDYYFDDVTAFQNWILASSQQLKLLPSELQQRCAHRIVELYLNSTMDRQPKNQQRIYQVDAFMVIAIKP